MPRRSSSWWIASISSGSSSSGSMTSASSDCRSWPLDSAASSSTMSSSVARIDSISTVVTCSPLKCSGRHSRLRGLHKHAATPRIKSRAREATLCQVGEDATSDRPRLPAFPQVAQTAVEMLIIQRPQIATFSRSTAPCARSGQAVGFFLRRARRGSRTKQYRVVVRGASQEAKRKVSRCRGRNRDRLGDFFWSACSSGA